jgi:hypothetical protein
VIRLWEHVPLDEAVATVMTTVGASRAAGPERSAAGADPPT